MINGFYNLDGKDFEYVIDGKRVYNPNTNKTITRIWAYPIKQGIWGGDYVIKYFSTANKRNEYMASHNYCDKLPRCKVPKID